MKNKILKNWLKIGALVLVLFAAFHLTDVAFNSVHAGLAIPVGEVDISEDIAREPLSEVVLNMVNYFIGFLGFIAVLAFVYAGVLWVVSGGAEEQITKAKKIMTYASLGLLVVILSFSIVTFIVGSAGGEPDVKACLVNSDCKIGQFCSTGKCANAADIPGFTCLTDNECPGGWSCVNSTCSPISDLSCSNTASCGPGEYCSVAGLCQVSTSISCNDNSACTAPKTCDPFGLCRNQGAGSGSNCEDSSDCPTGYVCNEEANSCEIQGSGGSGGVSGGETQALSQEALNDIDETINKLGDDLGNIQEEIDSLSDEDKADVQDILKAGTLADKLAGINSIIASSNDPAVIAILEKLLSGLQKLQILRDQLDDLRAVMPESEETIEAWDEVSKALNELIDTPTSNIKLRRFENLYRALKERIRKFPIVLSRIRAVPGEGNIPFTVTFDGLDSVDPTGGTISDYKWSFLDNSGNLVSLGNSPVVIHEFTEPNTFSIVLQVSTSNTDSAGYKTAMDGVSTVRVRARPPFFKGGFPDQRS